eukprot:6373874-Amphidinium_carterae.1
MEQHRYQTSGAWLASCDGSCLFHSVGRAIAWNPKVLRTQVAEWLLHLPHELRPLWFDPTTTPEQEGQRLRGPGAWGGELAIWALAQLL